MRVLGLQLEQETLVLGQSSYCCSGISTRLGQWIPACPTTSLPWPHLSTTCTATTFQPGTWQCRVCTLCLAPCTLHPTHPHTPIPPPFHIPIPKAPIPPLHPHPCQFNTAPLPAALDSTVVSTKTNAPPAPLPGPQSCPEGTVRAGVVWSTQCSPAWHAHPELLPCSLTAALGHQQPGLAQPQ